MAERTALFVRVPTPLAERLAERARTSGRSKQAVVTELLTSSDTIETAMNQPPSAGGDILDLDEVAALLRISTMDVFERIADGDFPARRFGTEWRFSHRAVLDWLSGTDPAADRETGFTPPSR